MFIFKSLKAKMNNQEVYGLIWVDICTINKFRVKNKIIQNAKDQKKNKSGHWCSRAFTVPWRREREICWYVTEEMTRGINASDDMSKLATTDLSLQRDRRRRKAFAARDLFISKSSSRDDGAMRIRPNDRGLPLNFFILFCH